ncbi:MAG TPA: hypothetical protein VF944_04200 [Candidatus Bathyarchaeia archaeon]
MGILFIGAPPSPRVGADGGGAEGRGLAGCSGLYWSLSVEFNIEVEG